MTAELITRTDEAPAAVTTRRGAACRVTISTTPMQDPSPRAEMTTSRRRGTPRLRSRSSPNTRG